MENSIFNFMFMSVCLLTLFLSVDKSSWNINAKAKSSTTNIAITLN